VGSSAAQTVGGALLQGSVPGALQLVERARDARPFVRPVRRGWRAGRGRRTRIERDRASIDGLIGNISAVEAQT
jgi:hypothetical protein